MIIEYDPQADAMYIQLRKGDIVETVETNKYIYTDVDQDGWPLGIEILFVKRHLALEDLSSVTFNRSCLRAVFLPHLSTIRFLAV
jgi:uncharacterized protein YuzE